MLQPLGAVPAPVSVPDATVANHLADDVERLRLHSPLLSVDVIPPDCAEYPLPMPLPLSAELPVMRVPQPYLISNCWGYARSAMVMAKSGIGTAQRL